MKNILNKNDFVQIRKRINSIDGSEIALWGKMNVGGMLCHATDQIRLATGETQCQFGGNFLTTTIIKKIILLGMPVPKGKIETFPSIEQGAGGTKPSSIENDKVILSQILGTVEKSFETIKFRTHPSFGQMDLKGWGCLIYIHLNHHLKQFGK